MAGSKVVIPSALLGIVGIAVAVVTVRDLFSQIRRPRPVAIRSLWMSIGPMPNAYSTALGDPFFFNSGRVASIAVDPGDPAHCGRPARGLARRGKFPAPQTREVLPSFGAHLTAPNCANPNTVAASEHPTLCSSFREL